MLKMQESERCMRIEETVSFFFLYNSKLIDADRKVSLDVNDQRSMKLSIVPWYKWVKDTVDSRLF